ncbi:MAG: hypothetical protein HY681_07265 [Chloroflexi bacterium]|nr:hypothetical protein [Chloroflexota bacterium]
MKHLNNPKKIDAIISMATWLTDDRNWVQVKAALKANNLSFFRQFPFIGPITQYHLARNIGLDYAKPDRWLLREAEYFGYGPTALGVKATVDFIAKSRGHRPGVIDCVLWRWAEQHPWYFEQDDEDAT